MSGRCEPVCERIDDLLAATNTNAISSRESPPCDVELGFGAETSGNQDVGIDQSRSPTTSANAAPAIIDATHTNIRSNLTGLLFMLFGPLKARRAAVTRAPTSMLLRCQHGGTSMKA